MPTCDPNLSAAADPAQAIHDMCMHAAALLDAAEASGNCVLVANVRAFVEELVAGIKQGVPNLDEADHDCVPRLS